MFIQHELNNYKKFFALWKKNKKGDSLEWPPPSGFRCQEEHSIKCFF